MSKIIITNDLLEKADKWLINNFGSTYMKISQEGANELVKSLAKLLEEYKNE